MHDELGDAVELDEAMTLRALDMLARWQSKFGLYYDYYLLDAFWFDPTQPYTSFKQPNWPEGFARARARMAELGMTPGLWYDVNSSWLKVSAWEASLSASGRGYSLAEGPYATALEAGWRHALQEWGVRLFKLDFANFNLAAAGSRMAPAENYNRSVEALRGILTRLRRDFPDLVVIAYNGFERWPGFVSTAIGTPSQAGFDRSWLDVCDYLYSGDPRPSDLPRTSLKRSIDIFQDHKAWLMARDGFPPERVDDHGCMVGSTNTSFYQGARGLQRTYLGTLARGSQRVIYYGDPALASDEQVRFMANAQALYFDAYRSGLCTIPVGGEPGVAPWHGFLTGGGAHGLLYLVNGSCSSQQTSLRLPGVSRARVLSADETLDVPLAVSPDQLQIELLPEQMALVGLGALADSGAELGVCTGTPQPAAMHLLPLVWQAEPEGRLVSSYRGAWEPGEELVVYAASLAHPQHGRAGLVGGYLPERFGAEMTKKGERPACSQAHAELVITVKEGAGALEPLASEPAVPIWAGTSWVARRYQLTPEQAQAGITLSVQQHFNPERVIRVQAYRVRYL